MVAYVSNHVYECMCIFTSALWPFRVSLLTLDYISDAIILASARPEIPSCEGIHKLVSVDDERHAETARQIVSTFKTSAAITARTFRYIGTAAANSQTLVQQGSRNSQ